MKSLFLGAFVFLLLAAGESLAAERILIGGLNGIDPHSDHEPLRVKLALSGGGARGLAVVGVLRAFEERGIQTMAITGTSIGGIVGGLYACGYSAGELTDIVREIDVGTLLSNRPSRRSMFLTKRQGQERHLLSIRFDGFRPQIPSGYTTGQEVTALLTSLTSRANYLAGGDFTCLPIPFKTVSTDIVAGEEVVLDSGSLANAMRASIGFPLAFTGVDTGSRLLMDGGMVTPVPVDVVREMGDTRVFVVAINTTSPLLLKEEIVTPVDIAEQVTSIMTADQLQDQLSRADYVIEPCPEHFSSTDFKHRDSIIESGYRYGLRSVDSISAILHQHRDTSAYRIDEVRVVTNNRPLADQLTTALLGRTMNRSDLLVELKALFIRNDLFELTADLEPVPDPVADSIDSFMTVAVTLAVQEAIPSSDIALEFSGNSIYEDSALSTLFLFPDSTVTPGSLATGLQRVTSLYSANGYDLAWIRDVVIDPEKNRIEVLIDEAIVQRIDVEQNERTKDWLVRSYFPLKRWEPYSTRKASQGIDNIYATDLFQRVTLDLKPADSGAILKIGVTEKKYSQLRLGWHWHNEYRSEQFLELLDDNMLGIGMEHIVHAQYGIDRRKYFMSLRTHRIFSTYLTAQVRLAHDWWDRPIFNGGQDELGIRNEERLGGLISIGQQIARLGTVTGALVLEEIWSTDRRTGKEERLSLRAIRLQSQLETFDRIPFPETGNKNVLELVIAGKALSGDVEYNKFFASLESYFPLGKYLNFHPKVMIGISRTGLPPSEQFHVGGSESFCGFRSNQLSGDKVLLANQELRLRLPLRLYLFARYDVGEVYNSSDQIKLRNLRHGYGFFLALDTPIGPFEFGYGNADKDFDRFYFNAGFAF